MIETTTSADGTTIAFERAGHGDPLLLLGGASDSRMSAAGLAQLLAPYFTVFTIDRRGHGDGSAPPIEREVEDVAAVLRAAGGEAHLYGHSSGAVLALAAAASGLSIVRLAVFDPPHGDVTADGLAQVEAPTLVIASESGSVGALPHATTHVVDSIADSTIAVVLEEFFG